jgi:hypothetical protein
MTGVYGVAGLLQGTVKCKPEPAKAQPPNMSVQNFAVGGFGTFRPNLSDFAHEA